MRERLPVVALNLFVNFKPVNRHILRRLDSNAHGITINPDDGHDDSRADHDALSNFSR